MDAFLGDIFNQDSELLDYVRKLFGYALNGHTREEIFVLLLGAGGKVSRLSTLTLEGQCRRFSNPGLGFCLTYSVF